MKPWTHAKSSVHKWGGKPKDYIAIHDMMDSSKSLCADHRHRVLFHHAAGPYYMEQIFGHTIKNSDGREVIVKDIAEQHIVEDLGRIPSFNEYLNEMDQAVWMSGARFVTKGKPNA